jgi:hypothetical protein
MIRDVICSPAKAGVQLGLAVQVGPGLRRGAERDQ